MLLFSVKKDGKIRFWQQKINRIAYVYTRYLEWSGGENFRGESSSNSCFKISHAFLGNYRSCVIKFNYNSRSCDLASSASLHPPTPPPTPSPYPFFPSPYIQLSVRNDLIVSRGNLLTFVNKNQSRLK